MRVIDRLAQREASWRELDLLLDRLSKEKVPDASVVMRRSTAGTQTSTPASGDDISAFITRPDNRATGRVATVASAVKSTFQAISLTSVCGPIVTLVSAKGTPWRVRVRCATISRGTLQMEKRPLSSGAYVSPSECIANPSRICAIDANHIALI